MCVCVSLSRRANIVCYSTIVCWMFQGRLSLLLQLQPLPAKKKERKKTNLIGMCMLRRLTVSQCKRHFFFFLLFDMFTNIQVTDMSVEKKKKKKQATMPLVRFIEGRKTEQFDAKKISINQISFLICCRSELHWALQVCMYAL